VPSREATLEARTRPAYHGNLRLLTGRMRAYTQLPEKTVPFTETGEDPTLHLCSADSLERPIEFAGPHPESRGATIRAALPAARPTMVGM
jgi:hypothetical protein